MHRFTRGIVFFAALSVTNLVVAEAFTARPNHGVETPVKALRLLRHNVFAGETRAEFVHHCPFSVDREGDRLEGRRCGKGVGNGTYPIVWSRIVPLADFGDCAGNQLACRDRVMLLKASSDLHNWVPIIGNDAKPDAVPALFRRGVTMDYRLNLNKVEPVIQGDVARVFFYMRDAYGYQINEEFSQRLLEWASSDPADTLECKRHNRIEYIQGNANPYTKASCAQAGNTGLARTL